MSQERELRALSEKWHKQAVALELLPPSQIAAHEAKRIFIRCADELGALAAAEGAKGAQARCYVTCPDCRAIHVLGECTEYRRAAAQHPTSTGELRDLSNKWHELADDLERPRQNEVEAEECYPRIALSRGAQHLRECANELNVWLAAHSAAPDEQGALRRVIENVFPVDWEKFTDVQPDINLSSVHWAEGVIKSKLDAALAASTAGKGAQCIGYPDCDGDLEGETHSASCPLAAAGKGDEGGKSMPPKCTECGSTQMAHIKGCSWSVIR